MPTIRHTSYCSSEEKNNVCKMYIFFELNQLYTVSDSLLRDLDHYDVMTTKPDKKNHSTESG
jgi:hypothetical protein